MLYMWGYGCGHTWLRRAFLRFIGPRWLEAVEAAAAIAAAAADGLDDDMEAKEAEEGWLLPVIPEAAAAEPARPAAWAARASEAVEAAWGGGGVEVALCRSISTFLNLNFKCFLVKVSESTIKSAEAEGLLLVFPVDIFPVPLELPVKPDVAFSFSKADLEAFMAFLRGPYTVSACGEAPAGDDWMKFGVDFEVCWVFASSSCNASNSDWNRKKY